MAAHGADRTGRDRPASRSSALITSSRSTRVVARELSQREQTVRGVELGPGRGGLVREPAAPCRPSIFATERRRAGCMQAREPDAEPGLRVRSPGALDRSTRAPDGWASSSETASTRGHRDRIGFAQPREARRLGGEELRRGAGMGLGEDAAPVGESQARTRPRRLHHARARRARCGTPIARSSADRSRSFMVAEPRDTTSGPVPCGHVRAGSLRGCGPGLGVPAARRFVGIQQRRAGGRRRDRRSSSTPSSTCS